MNAKEFADRVLGGELKEGRGLGRGAVEDAAEGIFGCWNAEDQR